MGARPAAAALVTLATLVAAYGASPGVSRAVGEQDGLLFRNFHDLETIGGTPYRWSKGGNRRDERASTIVVPQVGHGDGSVLQLQVRAPEDTPVPVTLSAGGETLLVTSVQGRRTVSLTLPRSALSGGDAQVVVTSPGWTRGKDPRARGIAVERVGWTPSGWMLPPLRQVLLLPAFAAALALLFHRLGAPSRIAELGPALAGPLLALGAAWRPLEVAPFSHRFLIAALLAHAGLFLWGGLVGSPGRAAWAVPSVVPPTSLLLLMAVGYWMMVAYHGVLCYETRRFCPTPAAGLMGLLVLAGLAAVVLLLPPARRPAIALLVIGAGGGVLALASFAAAFRRPAVDFVTLWTAAHDFSLGGSLYKPAEVAANHFGAVFKVPPFYGMLLLPFARTDVRSALALDRALDVALFLACAAAIAVWLRGRLGGSTAAAAVLVVMGLMQPAFDAIAYGQIDIVLLGLVALALLGLRTGRPSIAGLGVALAALLKLYPLVLVLFLAARREWRAVAWTMAWLFALVAIAVAVMGWQEHVVYATEVLPRIGGGTGWVENQTVNGFLSRLIVGARRPEPVHDRAVDLLTWASLVLIAGASTLAAARRTDPRSSAAALLFGAFLVVMVMAVPAAWIHYETVTILSFLLLAWTAAERPLSPRVAFAVALAFGLVAYGNQWTFYDGSPRPGLTVLGLSRELYGLVLLWAAALVAGASEPPGSPRPPDRGPTISGARAAAGG